MGWKAATDLVALGLKGTVHRLTGSQTHSLALSSSAGAVKSTGAYREELSCVASGQALEEQGSR